MKKVGKILFLSFNFSYTNHKQLLEFMYQPKRRSREPTKKKYIVTSQVEPSLVSTNQMGAK